ncbi:MAG TPA: PAS domain-containing protein [Candidatus Acidoferrum sp.]|nr:PAS domain-containing protein [Candidatus Acidoferrum sp.]
MPTRRSSAEGAHAAKSVIKKPVEVLASLSPEILKGMPVGLIVLHLENLKDPRTFKVIEINPAAATLTGAKLEDLRGKTLGDFPRLLQTKLPVSCLEALRA